MKRNEIEISIIIPCYNSEQYIIKNIETIRHILLKKKINYQIILIDDYSRDNTHEILRINFKNLSNFIIIKNSQNFGKGYCIKKGIKESLNCKKIMFIDADLPYLKYFELFLNKLLKKDIDFLFCERRGKVNNSSKLISIRSFFSATINKIIRFFFSIKTQDTQAGLKGFNNKAASKFQNIKTNGFLFDVELFLISKKFNFKIDKIIVSSNSEDYSSEIMYKLAIYLKVIKDLLYIYWSYIINKK